MAGVIWHPSPNFGPRRNRARPDMVVIHYTAMQSAQAALDRLCDPAFEVSAHYLIGRDGVTYQLVSDDMRAWHAGAGSWGGVDDVNSRSIGIELDNSGLHPFAEPQMVALEGLLSGLLERWSIPLERVIAHSDMAPARKTDPGRRFDWRRLAIQGMAVWAEYEHTDGHDQSWFRDFAETVGYDPNNSDEALLEAFRSRFRPEKFGKMDAGDLKLIQNLAKRFPVDRILPTT